MSCVDYIPVIRVTASKIWNFREIFSETEGVDDKFIIIIIQNYSFF